VIDDINAEPDYGDEPPLACSSRVFLGHDSFACGGTPGHAGKHDYRLPWVTIEWDGRAERSAVAAEPQPAPGRAELETAMAAALQNLIDEDDDEDDREYLSTIIEMLTVFDDDRIMIEHLLSGRNKTPEGAALLKIWEIGRRAIEGRAPSLRAILAEVLDSYGPSGSAHVSRVSRVTVIRWRIRAGLPVTEAERKMAGV